MELAESESSVEVVGSRGKEAEEEILKVIEKEAIEEDDEMKEEEDDSNKKDETNPYAYLNRDEFCSERFKIELRNLPRQYGFTELKKFLIKSGLKPHKIKKGTAAGHFVFISFRTEEDREKAKGTLDGKTWKNKVLEASFASAAKDPLIKQRATTTTTTEVEVKEVEALNEPIDDIMKKVTMPWYDIPYEEQLTKKDKSAQEYTWDLYKLLCSTNPDLKKLPTPFWTHETILPSPVTSHYRNKCEFTIGINPETSVKTVGFRLSSYKRGSKSVGPISALTHLPEKMIQAAEAFEKFIQKTPYEPFDPETHEGVWKQLTVRTSSQDVMLMIIISDKELKGEDVESLKKDITKEFQELENPKITTFLFKTNEAQGQKTKNAPELLFGSGFLREKMSDLNFRISPESFFQVNCLGAEVLVKAIQKYAELDEDTCLLDICCGTGTLGLSLAQYCGEVHGVEMVGSAVEDARVNAKDNQLEDKCQFYCGKAEDVIDALTYQAKKKKIVAILDPPRAGVHIKVLQTLRRCPKIDTIIFVSCDMQAAKRNFIDFARQESKKYRLSPFVPRKFIPVDLFPLSPHMELIVVLKRVDSPNNPS